jgi:hypothetical protein
VLVVKGEGGWCFLHTFSRYFNKPMTQTMQRNIQSCFFKDASINTSGVVSVGVGLCAASEGVGSLPVVTEDGVVAVDSEFSIVEDVDGGTLLSVGVGTTLSVTELEGTDWKVCARFLVVVAG